MYGLQMRTGVSNAYPENRHNSSLAETILSFNGQLRHTYVWLVFVGCSVSVFKKIYVVKKKMFAGERRY